MLIIFIILFYFFIFYFYFFYFLFLFLFFYFFKKMIRSFLLKIFFCFQARTLTYFIQPHYKLAKMEELCVTRFQLASVKGKESEDAIRKKRKKVQHPE